MPSLRVLLLCLALATALACSRSPAAVTPPVVATASPAPQPPGEVREAIDALRTGLQIRLQAAVQAGGPAGAIDVCRAEAPALTASASTPGVRLGRTSFRLRNPANAPPAWAADLVRASAGQRVADARPHAVDLAGGRRGWLVPIGTQAVCVTCHGPPDQLAEPVRQRLARQYPQDAATGFAEGDLRGWFWAEVAGR